MESHNYNSVHILSEAVIMGGISMYFYKKILELESTIEDLKSQITMQNNQIRYILGSRQSQPGLTPLKIPNPPSFKKETNYSTELHQRQPLIIPPESTKQQVECEEGVCRLIPKPRDKPEESSAKKVVISKISKKIEFDSENIELNQTSKVNTFNNFSPNPVLESITPKPSTSISENIENSETELEKILNDIDDE